MGVAVIDGSVWLVSAPPAVADRLRAARPAEDVPPGGVVPPVWGR